MNIFRLAGDICHLFAIIILLFKIWKTKSVSGLSGKSLVLFALVFTTRYLDLFTTYISLYNTAMKIFFIASSYATVFFFYHMFKHSANLEQDNFRVEILIIPAAILACVINAQFTALEVLWTFSIYLEAVAILPQMFMLQQRGEAETITAHYLFCLGLYRGLYILNWIYRYQTEQFYDPIAIVAGVVQTVLYADFFYIYFNRVIKEKAKMALPI
uniref:ER lumen protein-retaining receptor n=1 Tax=Parastrongyloides trichosuri TaxID=131310 RepID=A0A0N4Z9T5_PARTI